MGNGFVSKQCLNQVSTVLLLSNGVQILIYSERLFFVCGFSLTSGQLLRPFSRLTVKECINYTGMLKCGYYSTQGKLKSIKNMKNVGKVAYLSYTCYRGWFLLQGLAVDDGGCLAGTGLVEGLYTEVVHGPCRQVLLD